MAFDQLDFIGSLHNHLLRIFCHIVEPILYEGPAELILGDGPASHGVSFMADSNLRDSHPESPQFVMCTNIYLYHIALS